MNHNSHTVLHLNLEDQSFEIKNHTNLSEFLGGYGVGLNLLEENLDADPVVFSIGPLTAVFPFASKTCVVAARDKVRSSYVGGGFGAALKFSGLDALLIKGKAPSSLYLVIKDHSVIFHKLEAIEPVWKNESLLGQISFLEVENEPLVDHYFRFSKGWLGENLLSRNLKAIVISGTKSFSMENLESYRKIFKGLLSRADEVETAASSRKSCFACPLGCERSREGDDFPDSSLSQFLISCHFASKVFEDIPTVFACLNSLGYPWSHEDLEKLPEKVVKLKEEINKKLKIKNSNF